MNHRELNTGTGTEAPFPFTYIIRVYVPGEGKAAGERAAKAGSAEPPAEGRSSTEFAIGGVDRGKMGQWDKTCISSNFCVARFAPSIHGDVLSCFAPLCTVVPSSNQSETLKQQNFFQDHRRIIEQSGFANRPISPRISLPISGSRRGLEEVGGFYYTVDRAIRIHTHPRKTHDYVDHNTDLE